MLLPNFSLCSLEAGCDEAGRGCLAGPVFASAVILPQGFSCEELNDSKLLTHKQRIRLRELIEDEAIACSVATATAEEIDRNNILNATLMAMHRALDLLNIEPEYIIVDGNRFASYKDIPYKTIIGGDGKRMSIAAASVLAKTYRDEYMDWLHKQYPVYYWDENRGYPTIKHREAIEQYGITIYHRYTFIH